MGIAFSPEHLGTMNGQWPHLIEKFLPMQKAG